MLMVIFGAGASYDSSPTYSIGMAPPGAGEQSRDNAYYRPPLAKAEVNRILALEGGLIAPPPVFD